MLTFRVFLLHGSMADAIPGWHSAKVPNHLSLRLLRKPQTPLLEPHPYDCIQASFPPQGPASRYHRHTLFGDCVFNIRILGSTLGTHDFLDSSLRPLPQSWNSLFLLSTSSNLWNLTFSKDLLSDKLLCVSSAHAIHVNYMLKKQPRKAEQRQLNHPFIISLYIACWLRLCFGI